MNVGFGKLQKLSHTGPLTLHVHFLVVSQLIRLETLKDVQVENHLQDITGCSCLEICLGNVFNGTLARLKRTLWWGAGHAACLIFVKYT